MEIDINENLSLEDIQFIVDQQLPENLHREYKSTKLFRSPFLINDPGNNNQRAKVRKNSAQTLTKEISVFANTEGGTIIVGIEEIRIARGARVAGQLSEGIPITLWTPETINQMVIDGLHPNMRGLRIYPIFLDDDRTQYYVAIHVPKGYTAYQAKDFLYYGRSEYSSIPLRDHEIRMRMFQHERPSAILKISGLEGKLISEKEMGRIEIAIKESFGESEENTRKRTLQPEEQFSYFTFHLILENCGLMNIHEFRLDAKFIDYPDNLLILTGYYMKKGMTWKRWDGMVSRVYGTETRETVKIYPDEEYMVSNVSFGLWGGENPEDALKKASLSLQCKVYLTNRLPITSTILLADMPLSIEG